MIRYYSAAQRATAWTRAMDFAFIASLLLAFPAAWLGDAMVIQPTVAIDLSGQLSCLDDSSFAALLLLPNSERDPHLPGKPCGNFQLRVHERHRGWPLTTSVERQPAQLDVDLLSENIARKNVQLATDDPLRPAIEESLRLDHQHEALAAWRQSRPHLRQHWLSWSTATGIWWIVFVFASSLAISMARYSTQIAKGRVAARRARLRSTGKCLTCGYDMTGLEFNERCPECGELVW